MSIKPILFNTEMVRALLDGSKTATRRVVKGFALEFIHAVERERAEYVPTEGQELRPISDACDWAPYRPDDVLYVRETWAKCQNAESYVYKADFDGYAGEAFLPLMKWHPSIHMPKEAARIFLRVTGVRVERLREMKMSDIQAEGVVPSDVTGGHWQQWQRDYMKPVWDSTVKPADLDIYGWEANPWVWVIEFERVEVDHD